MVTLLQLRLELFTMWFAPLVVPAMCMLAEYAVAARRSRQANGTAGAPARAGSAGEKRRAR